MTRGIVVVAALAGCGRVGFDQDRDAAPATFCATHATAIPSDAVSALCVDFDDRPLGVLADQIGLAADHHLYARGTPGFTTIAVIEDAVATTPAFSYTPATGSVCSDGCCYSDLFLDFGASTFVDHAHFEYDHYVVDTGNGAWIGSMFWGALAYPYMQNFVTPSLDLDRWTHVDIDADVGATQQLTIRVDGVVRTNNAGSNDLHSGIDASIGTFCWGVPGAGYVDNVLFWGR